MHANTMMVKVAMCLLFSMRMTSHCGAERANLLRQRKTRREVDAASPVVAVAAPTQQEQQTTRELGLVEAVEEEEEEENLEVDHYFRRTVQSSLNQKKYNCRCRLLFISVEKYAKVYYWTI